MALGETVTLLGVSVDAGGFETSCAHRSHGVTLSCPKSSLQDRRVFSQDFSSSLNPWSVLVEQGVDASSAGTSCMWEVGESMGTN